MEKLFTTAASQPIFSIAVSTHFADVDISPTADEHIFHDHLFNYVFFFYWLRFDSNSISISNLMLSKIKGYTVWKQAATEVTYSRMSS